MILKAAPGLAQVYIVCVNKRICHEFRRQHDGYV